MNTEKLTFSEVNELLKGTKLTNALEEWDEETIERIKRKMKPYSKEDFDFNFCYGLHLGAYSYNDDMFESAYEYYIIVFQLKGAESNNVSIGMLTQWGFFGQNDVIYNGDDWRFINEVKDEVDECVIDFSNGIRNRMYDILRNR